MKRRLFEADDHNDVGNLLKQLIDIGRKGDARTKSMVIRKIGDLKRGDITHDAPEVLALPHGSRLFDAQPSDQQQSTGSNQPQQAQLPQQPAVTNPVTDQQSVAPAQAASAASTNPPTTGTPQAIPASPVGSTVPPPVSAVNPTMGNPAASSVTPPAQSTAAEQSPAQPAQSSLYQQLKPLLTNPQTNQQQFIQTLANSVHTAPMGSPQRAEIVKTIQYLKSQKPVTDRFPLLNQVNISESRRLYEADEELSRSEIDRIFMNLAQEIIAAGHISTSDDTPGQESDNRNSAADEADDDATDENDQQRDLRYYKNGMLNAYELARAIKKLPAHDERERQQAKLLLDVLEKAQRQLSLQDVMQQANLSFDKVYPKVKIVIIKAIIETHNKR